MDEGVVVEGAEPGAGEPEEGAFDEGGEVGLLGADGGEVDDCGAEGGGEEAAGGGGD